MTKTKRLVALLVVVAMLFAFVAAVAACDDTETPADHVCGHVCPTCHKCLDKNCQDEVCKDKCDGHQVEDEHTCSSKCEVCNKCLDTTCQEDACKDKCDVGGVHGSDDEHECESKCDKCDKCQNAECTEDACQDKCECEDVGGDDHECESKCDTCGKCQNEDCDEEACKDKCECEDEEQEYKVTLIVNSELGSLVGDVKTEYTTINGVITESLPAPSVTKANYDFFGWYTMDNGAGDEVVENETVFTENTEIYAFIGRKTGVWVNGEGYNALVKNNAASGSGLLAEYWFGGSKKTFQKDEVLTVYMNGRQLSFYIVSSSAGINVPTTSSKVNSVTVTVSGEFDVYLKLYSSATDPNNWSCEFGGPTEVGSGSEIPAGCDPVHITWGSGAYELTLYFVNGNGESVGTADFGKYVIYTFGPELFGTWQNGVLQNLGYLKSEMTSTATGMPTWIFRWGSISTSNGNGGYQTSNIAGAFENKCTYLVKLPKTNGDAEIIKLELPAAE